MFMIIQRRNLMNRSINGKKNYFTECTEDRTYRDTEHNTKGNL